MLCLLHLPLIGCFDLWHTAPPFMALEVILSGLEGVQPSGIRESPWSAYIHQPHEGRGEPTHYAKPAGKAYASTLTWYIPFCPDFSGLHSPIPQQKPPKLRMFRICSMEYCPFLLYRRCKSIYQLSNSPR